MGNLAVPTGKPITVDANFNMYLSVATENSTSKNYDAEDLAQIKNLSEALSTEIEKIDDGVLPSDRSFKVRGVKKATRNLVEGINKAKDEKYNKLLSTETQALFSPSKDVKEIVGAQELRDSFKQFAGDGPLIGMFVLKLTDEQFDVLRFAQPTPVIKKDTAGVVTSVTMAPMVPIDLERSELLRRRPAIAERLEVFEFRKQAFRGLSKTLSDLVDKRLEAY